MDNKSCIDLISKKPNGILHILDDESNFPQVYLSLLMIIKTSNSILLFEINLFISTCIYSTLVLINSFGLEPFYIIRLSPNINILYVKKYKKIGKILNFCIRNFSTILLKRQQVKRYE